MIKSVSCSPRTAVLKSSAALQQDVRELMLVPFGPSREILLRPETATQQHLTSRVNSYSHWSSIWHPVQINLQAVKSETRWITDHSAVLT